MDSKSLSVFVLMPTAMADHAWDTFSKWKAMGYKLALFTDKNITAIDENFSLHIRGDYPGVWNACNALAKATVSLGSDVCVFAGDDMHPDPHHDAQEIGRQYLEKFPQGQGVMQPCGDPQGMDATGKPAAARICGSAWFGRQWINQSYGSSGPTNGAYWHFYSDEELALVAEREGVLWWREDLIQDHLHWSYGRNQMQPYHARNQEHWDRDKELFIKRKEAGFP